MLGRPGEAEPLAAALALTLRRPAATVVVVGAPAVATDAPAGGTRAARRLAARLASRGLAATSRGRLAWAHVAPEDATRAALAGSPAVLAIATPLTPTLEQAIAAQDLAIVIVPHADDPLATLALDGLVHLGITLHTAPAVRRGLARRFALAGLRTPRNVVDLVTP